MVGSSGPFNNLYVPHDPDETHPPWGFFPLQKWEIERGRNEEGRGERERERGNKKRKKRREEEERKEKRKRIER